MKRTRSRLLVSPCPHLRLFVYVVGPDTPSAFPVIIESCKTVGELKKAILQEKPNVLKGVGADQLTLYRVDKDLNAHSRDSLSRLAINRDLELTEWELISDYWPEQPAAKRLHILVQLPDTTGVLLLLRRTSSDISPDCSLDICLLNFIPHRRWLLSINIAAILTPMTDLSHLHHLILVSVHTKSIARQYKPSDKVYLSMENLPVIQATKKLDSKFVGPFEIVKKVGKSAYQLKIPAS